MAKQRSYQEKLSLSDLEIEVIVLKASLDLIDDMVNRETMCFYSCDNSSEAEVKFTTRIHQAYFSILLVDFLSSPDKKLLRGCGNYLQRLDAIGESPLLGDSKVEALSGAVKSFRRWLEEKEINVQTWFPALNLKIDLAIERQQFITICGNMSKHHFTRQTRQAEKLQKLLKENDYCFPIDKCLMALEDFYTRFGEDILLYHATMLAKFLNDIRWGIYEYAHVERVRSIASRYDENLELTRYEYCYPKSISSRLGETSYWDLMNAVEKPPSIPRFEVNRLLKEHY
ncbi:MAG: hypothetical protein OXE05_11350 [Chloroflexi bacterium]|nr:hypothetical protein [Chloroflexota bacterium]